MIDGENQIAIYLMALLFKYPGGVEEERFCLRPYNEKENEEEDLPNFYLIGDNDVWATWGSGGPGDDLNLSDISYERWRSVLIDLL